jgi:hypothetical protein
MTRILAISLLVLFGGVAVAAQESRPGPLTPPAPPKVVRIPAEPEPEPPPVPVEEIIRRFTENEQRIQQAREGYLYRQTVRIQEFDEFGRSAGQFDLDGRLEIGADGQKVLRVAEQPISTLRRMSLSATDIGALVRTPLFTLLPSELHRYEITYIGVQLLDELSTYVFRVRPAQLDRQRALFEGVVWVDDSDFAVVRMLGTYVTETDEQKIVGLFSRQEIFREHVDGNWFPAYLSSTESQSSELGDLRTRLVIRYLDYQRANGAQ